MPQKGNPQKSPLFQSLITSTDMTGPYCSKWQRRDSSGISQNEGNKPPTKNLAASIANFRMHFRVESTWSHSKAWNHGMWNLTMTMEDCQVHHGTAVLQIRTPSCTTWFLTAPSIIPQSASLQHLLLECSSNKSSKKRWKWPPLTNGTKDWHQPMSQACRTQHGQRHTNLQSDTANTTHLTKILAVNHKQLSGNIIDPLFLWYLWVDSVKAEPQWEKHPIVSDKSFVTSEKTILGFYFIAKMAHILCHLFAYAHNLLSSRLPSGRTRNLLLPHLPGAWQGRLGPYPICMHWDTPQKMTVLQKFYLIFVPEQHFLWSVPGRYGWALVLPICQLLLDVLCGTTIEPPDKWLVFIVQTDLHHNHWLVLKAWVSTCCSSAWLFYGLLSMHSVVQKLPSNSTEIKNCSKTWCQQCRLYKTHVVVIKRSHYLLKELLVMVWQQTSNALKLRER
jgi:hypothetical protein